MSAEAVCVPASRMRALITYSGEMMISTAAVSPSARPRASIVPPMMPPLAKGSTTVFDHPNRVAPSAIAASRSPTGAWSKTARMTEQASGIAIMATARPAMKAELV